MSARFYTVSFGGVAVTAQQDLFYVAPADDKPCEIVGFFLGQSTEVGDAAEEFLRYAIIRGHTTVGSGGTAPTPRPVDRSGGAAGFTARVNDTTIASSGTGVTLHADTFNVRAGEKLWIPEGCWAEATQADGSIVVRLLSTPADSITFDGTLYVRETG
jgi:hypothetical protein